jgi:glucose/arabinose dehydrogenase
MKTNKAWVLLPEDRLPAEKNMLNDPCMNSLKTMFLLPLLLVMGCNWFSDQQNKNGAGTAAGSQAYKLALAFPNLVIEQPVELTSPEDRTNRIFVLGQRGIIQVFANKADTKQAAIFLDIKDRVVSGGERGLLGLAFHPDFKNNGYFYVNYTGGNPLETRISRFKVSAANPNQADAGSELVLLTYRQPYSNHNGGKVAFGNDGYLYIAAGDGGSGGDPQNYAQNRRELLGKILRIDVNKTSGSLPYAIPADNPYRSNGEGFREEIYAYGLRNPWRFSFDQTTGLLWAGDVGQNREEEVDVIEKGGNYGWRIMEAQECYQEKNCDKQVLILPVYSYVQGSSTGRSITGGYVCRDASLADLQGKYIYGDFVSGNIWALTLEGRKAVKNELVTTLSGGLSSFGQDSQKKLYVLNYGEGKIYHFVPEK